MKKLITASFLLYASINFAQITLEHTYPTYINIVEVNAGDWNYYTFSNPTLSIYDITHSLIKTISVPTLGGFNTNSISLISTNLFNTDSYYEYGVTYYNSSNYAYKFDVYNELGTQLFSIDSANYGSCYNTSAGLKMIVEQFHSRTGIYYAGNVYSLSGNFLATEVKPVNGDGNAEELLPYPNPSNNTIHLAYSLPVGTSTAEMFITNINGQIVKTCNVGSAFNDILLDTKQYAPGEYIYYIQSGRYTSTPTKFIISR